MSEILTQLLEDDVDEDKIEQWIQDITRTLFLAPYVGIECMMALVEENPKLPDWIFSMVWEQAKENYTLEATGDDQEWVASISVDSFLPEKPKMIKCQLLSLSKALRSYL